jgi:hypothetical protein
MQPITIEHRGKQITASLNITQTDTGQALSREEPPTWYVSIAGTALTKLPASPSDTEESVRARVLRWLRDHPEMLDRDQIVLGGG